MKLMLLLLAALTAGCTGIPDQVTPVGNFKVERYLGTWYELARLDHPFERGLSRVTADYTLRDDGGLHVVNRGYSAESTRWREAVGRAYFVGSRDTGHLKVSFFRPFYGSYVIFYLDHDSYRYSMVCGPNRSYLWILSRTPQMHIELKQRLIAKAAELGFDVRRLIFVSHD